MKADIFITEEEVMFMEETLIFQSKMQQSGKYGLIILKIQLFGSVYKESIYFSRAEI